MATLKTESSWARQWRKSPIHEINQPDDVTLTSPSLLYNLLVIDWAASLLMFSLSVWLLWCIDAFNWERWCLPDLFHIKLWFHLLPLKKKPADKPTRSVTLQQRYQRDTINMQIFTKKAPCQHDNTRNGTLLHKQHSVAYFRRSRMWSKVSKSRGSPRPFLPHERGDFYNPPQAAWWREISSHLLWSLQEATQCRFNQGR